MQPRVKLLDQVRAVARMRHLNPRTEDVYHNFIKRYILFHDKHHPKEMGAHSTHRASKSRGSKSRYSRSG
jgi:Phage integrase, N-terminal SAM-like domain